MKITASQMAEKIKHGKKIVFLTGAGVSTPSGIPDYRSIEGVYTKSGLSEPEYLLSRRAMLDDTEEFYAFIKKVFIRNAEPNVIHKKIAALQNDRNVTVITQNIDGLHEKAGSKNIVEFHGNICNCRCEKCEEVVSSDVFLESYTHKDCGGILRPNVVLYDEQIDPENIRRSQDALSQADTVVIVGTSFVVYPFAGLIQYANEKAKIYAVNKEKLKLGYLLNDEFVGDAVEVFELI